VAGRPRRMLAKVTSLEERVLDLMHDVDAAMPERYMQRPESTEDDPIWIAWYLASDKLSGAWVWLGQLRGLLERKVPEQQRNQTEDDAVENAEGAST